MNKKAFIIGNTLVTIVAIIAVIFIMGTFVLLSSGIAALKKPEIERTQVLAFGKNDFLLKQITITLPDNTQQQTFVYDALKLATANQLSTKELKKALDSSIKDSCYILAYSSYSYNGAIWGPGGTAGGDREVIKSDALLPAQIKLQQIKLTLNKKEYLVEYYSGDCPK